MTQASGNQPVFLEPGVGSSYGNGWRQLWKNFLELLLVLIIAWAVSAAFSIIGTFIDNTVWTFFNVLFSIFVSGPLTYGAYYASLHAARGDRVEISDLFAAFSRNYLNAVAANFLVGIIVVIGFILLIVPGIIFLCKLAFVPYLVIDKKMDAIAAIKTSWTWTNGHAGTIFLMGLLAIPILIIGAILFGIGIIPAGMWITVAFASQFHAVDLKRQPPQAAPVEPGGPFIMQ